jgi:Zn-dependent peptidase ImmA (M78 family)/DNA-binding XRE family transcriptional regulator
MNKVNPDMIVLARDLRGITQVELADALHLTQATVSRYESGQIDVPAEHLAAIGEFLGRPVSFFYWQDRLYDASCLYHRRNRRISVAEMKMIHAKVNLLRLQASRLLQQAKVKSKYSFHRLDPQKYGGPAGCARELRRLWQLPNGPVRHLVRSIESAGGMIFRCPFGATRVDGISQWPLDAPEMPPIFFVHDGIPGDRERLTLAHEVGHIVMHHLPTEGDPEEEANAFAVEFLMPAKEISHEFAEMTLSKAAAMKPFWKVSMQAIIMQAFRLKKISAIQYQRLYKQLSAKGYRKCEPAPIAPEEPEMFRGLLEFHRKTLGKSIAELGNYMGELPDSFTDHYARNLANFRLVG